MLHIECFKSINDVPENLWNSFASRDAVGLELNHLKAIELSQINDIHPYYLIGYSEEKPIGIAYCFSIQVDLARMANNFPLEVIDTIKTWKPDFMNLRIVEVGHLASLGSAIDVLQQYTSGFLKELSIKIDEIAKIENADLCIIRDIDANKFSDFRILEELGFFPSMGFPIARMQLGWKNFDEYLASLKAKKRFYIGQRREKLNSPEIKVEIINDYAPYAERLSELWTNVAKRQNGYEHEHLTPAYFQAMSECLKDRSHVIALKLEEKIVAFGLYLIGNEEYFGVAEGLDYEYRDNYDLYANNLLEGVRVGCELGMKSYNIGVTTYDFKTSIGAELEPCVYFVKALKEPKYSAVYSNLLQKSIKQPENHHRVFRDRDNAKRIQLKEFKSNLRNKNSSDPFTKLLNYIRVDTVRAANLYAHCPVFESAQEPVIKNNNREVIMLGTNCYLGLATHSAIKNATIDAINKYGSGCSGSPMLNGTLDLHKQLSDQLAKFMQKQDALLFSTGYQANLGALSALVNRDDVLIMDERNHASLVDGAILSRATIARYRHNDIESLEIILKKFSTRSKLIATDSLFSMEGTIVDLPKIVALAKKYNARIMLDESHAIGVIGPNGGGVADHFGLLNEVDIIMGTFSKSLASIGGFVAGDWKIIDTLRHTSRSHIFSASLPPASVAAVLAALQIIDKEPERRSKLLYNANLMAEGLKNLGYNVRYNGSAIVPLFCGNELLTLAAFHKLFEEGVFVNPVTYPAVPRNQEMLRISLMATHSEEMLYKALEVFKKIRTSKWPSVKI